MLSLEMINHYLAQLSLEAAAEVIGIVPAA